MHADKRHALKLRCLSGGRLHGKWLPLLIIMVKDPRAGGIKTRLAKSVGTVRATQTYRCMMHNVAGRLFAPKRWLTLLAVVPDAARNSRMLPSYPRISQGPGDIGSKMQRLLALSWPAAIVVIGSDIPQVSQPHIANAFSRLGRVPIVFGPASDGGFWLIGSRPVRRQEPAFDDVRWSSPHALNDSQVKLDPKAFDCVARLSDVDDADDMRNLQPYISRRVLPRN